jgi:NAD(P)-dependent dehydrogenase (short-subunit alcohol dehydrogenase family)
LAESVNAFTVQLAYELKDTKIKVNAAHPGLVKTDLGGEGAPMEIEDGAPLTCRAVRPRIVGKQAIMTPVVRKLHRVS